MKYVHTVGIDRHKRQADITLLFEYISRSNGSGSILLIRYRYFFVWYFVQLYVWQYIDDKVQFYLYLLVVFRTAILMVRYTFIHVWYFLQQEAWHYFADSMNHFIYLWYFLQQ